MVEDKAKRVFCVVSEEIHKRFHVACAKTGSKVQAVLEDFVVTYIDTSEKTRPNEEMWALIHDLGLRDLLRAAYKILTSGSARDQMILRTTIRALATKEDSHDATQSR